MHLNLGCCGAVKLRRGSRRQRMRRRLRKPKLQLSHKKQEVKEMFPRVLCLKVPNSVVEAGSAELLSFVPIFATIKIVLFSNFCTVLIFNLHD